MQGDLIIRADATLKIGSGHLIRCLVLAQAWKNLGGRVIFVTYCERNMLKKRILKEGVEVFPVESPHPNPSDLQQILSILKTYTVNLGCSTKKSQESPPWLILDGYHFDKNYQQVVHKAGYRLLVIDDLHNLSYYYADILLNQNLHAEYIQYHVKPDTCLLLGAKYILLQKKFLRYQTWIRPIPKIASKILITFGGSDLTDATSKILKMMIHWSDVNFDIKIVVGPMNNRLSKYKELLQGNLKNVSLISNTENMQELLVWADLAIICAGGTLWECLFLGCPTVSFSVNHVQKDILQSLHEKSMVHYVGDVNEVKSQDIKHSIESIVSSKYLRSELSKNGKDLVDGKGVSRIIDNMITIGELNG